MKQEDLVSACKIINLPLENIELLPHVKESLEQSRFVSTSSKTPELIALENGQITEEEYNDYLKSNIIFDYEADFDAYYCDFLTYYKIDLIDNLEICWFKFKMLLEGIMQKEEGVLAKRLQVRSFEADTKYDYKYNDYMLKQKDKYSLN